MHRRAGKAIAGGLLTLAATAVLAGQADWPTYGHDDGSTRFSALRQIDTTNVSRLTPAWTYHMAPPPSPEAAPATAPVGDAPPVAGGRGGRGGAGGMRASEATPIVVKNVMYLPTPYGRVVALQADSGKELWSYQVPAGQPTQRGVEFWPAGCVDHTIRCVVDDVVQCSGRCHPDRRDARQLPGVSSDLVRRVDPQPGQCEIVTPADRANRFGTNTARADHRDAQSI